MIRTVDFVDGKVRLIDQRLLPRQEVYIVCSDYKEVAEAIRRLSVRGAPAIGVAAALGAAMGARQIRADGYYEFWGEFLLICETFARTRPTAVNLRWALDRLKRVAEQNKNMPVAELKGLIVAEAEKILAEDLIVNKRLGKVGAELIRDGSTVLTHCNAGALATSAYGTALGVVRAAVEQGKKLRVVACETRPVLQGARLTAWELLKDGIEVKLITDNMAGHLMKKGLIDIAIVGADRIAANGDTANKIGTYTLAILAKEHKIPFYIAAPTSTLDMKAKSGSDIPIEERDPEEVTHISAIPIAPEGVGVYNPAFDVTPARYIEAIITEKGVLRRPFASNIKKLLQVA